MDAARRATSQNEICAMCAHNRMCRSTATSVLVFTCYCRISVKSTDQNSEKLPKEPRKGYFCWVQEKNSFHFYRSFRYFWDTSTNQNRGSRSVMRRFLREPTKKPKVPQKAALDKNASSPTRRIPLQSPLVSIGSHPQEVNFKKETTRFTIHQATHQT